MRLAQPSSPGPRARRLLRAAIGCCCVGLATAAAAAESGPPLAAAAIAIGAAQPADGIPLLLEVVINGEPRGQVGEFLRQGRSVLARPQELRDLGFAAAGDAQSAAIDLAGLKGVTYRIDEAAQQIFFTASIDALAAHRLQVAGADVALPEPSQAGFLVNYDAVATVDRTGAQANALIEARGFSGFFTGSSRFLVGVADGGTSLRRLDTSVDYSDAAHLRRFSAGDVVTGALVWTRPIRIGGIQASTAFAMRPDLITYPLPTIQGKTAVASTVDVLVNGVRQLSEQVPAGPFYVPQLPVAAGAGSVSVQVRDALGRTTRIDVTTYATEALLAKGLSSFSIEAGAIRRGYGSSGDSYGRLAASASYRRGLGAVTIEAHGEAAADLLSLGGGATFTIGDIAVAAVAASGSVDAGGLGKSAYFAIERQTRSYRLSFAAHLSDSRFADLAALAGDTVPRLFLQASGGGSLGVLGSLDLGYIYTRAGRGPSETPSVAAKPSRFSAGTLSYSRGFGQRFLLSANGFHDFTNGGSGVMASFSIGFGKRRQASASLSSSGGRSMSGVDVRQVGSAPGELSWDAYGGFDPKPRAFAQARIRTGAALLGGGIDYANGRLVAQASASGSVVWAEGALFAANPVRDSFAIVDAAGHAGLPVLQDNQLVGHTGRTGKLLLTDLRGFDGNRIAIRADDLPMAETIPETELLIRPSQRAGIVARFALREEASVLLTLIDTRGQPIEIGAFARLSPSDSSEPVGYDGRLFLRGVAARNRLDVELPDGRRCTVAFDGPSDRSQIAEPAPLVCDAT